MAGNLTVFPSPTPTPSTNSHSNRSHYPSSPTTSIIRPTTPAAQTEAPTTLPSLHDGGVSHSSTLASSATSSQSTETLSKETPNSITPTLHPKDEQALLQLSQQRHHPSSNNSFSPKRAAAFIKRATTLLQKIKTESAKAKQLYDSTQQSLQAERTSFQQQLDQQYSDIESRLEITGKNVEKESKELLLTVLENENAKSALDLREEKLRKRELQVEEGLKRRMREVEERENVLKKREIEIRGRMTGMSYSAVQEERLLNWAQGLARREEEIAKRERGIEERERDSVYRLQMREKGLREKEREKERGLQNRAAYLAKRELEVQMGKQALEREKKETGRERQIEEDKFWAHQKKISAVVAAETNALLEEQSKMRKKFEEEIANSREVLRKLQDKILRLQEQSPKMDSRGNEQ